MLFTTELAGVMSTRDRAPVQRTGWMQVGAAPSVSSGAFRLAPGVFIVRKTIAWPVSVLDVARHLPYDDDVVPVKRVFPFPDWHAQAACNGTVDADKLFFGVDDEGHPPLPPRYFKAARVICSVCPVRRACLTQALGHPESYGVWAGTTGRQRVPLRARIKAGEPVAKVVTEWLMQDG